MPEHFHAWYASLTKEDIGVYATVLGVLVALLAWLLPRSPQGVAQKEVHSAPASHPVAPEHLRVTSDFGFFTYNDPPRIGEDQMLIVTASNPTSKLYRVEGFGLVIEGSGNQIVFVDSKTIPAVPCALRETETVQAFKELKHIGRSLVQAGISQSVKLRPYARDSYGARHFGEPVDCTPLDWAKK